LLGQCGDGKLLLLAEAELTARNTYRTRDGAGADVLDSIKRLYNPKPRHSAISYVCQWTSS
jgi:putative transposase